MESDNNLRKPELTFEHFNLVSRLLRMKKALENWDIPRLYKHLKDVYFIDVKSPSQLDKIMNQAKGSGFYDNNNYYKWLDFIVKEKNTIISSLFMKGQFPAVQSSFNFHSAIELINATENAEKCVFWNTYIDMDEWSSPLVQMHLCIQKSIEQKNNFASIQKCHSIGETAKEKNIAVQYCMTNPPSYRHYRIAFLPLTDEEYTSKIEEKGAFYNNVKFSTIMHCAFSIRFAIVTATQLGKIMIKDESSLFSNQENLKFLGLTRDVSSLIEKCKTNRNQLSSDLELTLKNNIQLLNQVPKVKKEDGIDFLHIHHNGHGDNRDIWSAYDDVKNGLTYFELIEKQNIEIKRNFSNIVFGAITDSTSPQRLDIMELDPIYPFYLNNAKQLLSIVPKYNPQYKFGLYV